MTGKPNERRGPWHHAAVAALQGASIEEQLQYLDPDVVGAEIVDSSAHGMGLGFGFLGAQPGPRAQVAPPIDDTAENRAGTSIWGRWDAHGRGRLVRR